MAPEFVSVLAAIVGGAIGVMLIPLAPWNRAWTWDKYKAYWQGEMPFEGF